MRDSELVPDDFLPKYKGISLIFMFYTDITRYADITRYDINMDVEHDQGMALLGQSYHGASNLLRTVHDVDIPGTDIRLYYISARNQATAAGFEWDKHAVAHIIRSQAKDRGTFDDIASSLETYCNDQRCAVMTRWLMEMGLRLGKNGEFPSYEESTTEGKPAIPDPRLKSTGSADPTYWVKCNRKGAEDLEKSPRRSQAEGGNQLGDTVGTDYIVGEGPMGWNAIFSASD